MRYKSELLVAGETGEQYRLNDFVEVEVRGAPYQGRIDFIDKEGIYLDNSTRYHADNRQFTFDEIEYMREVKEHDAETV